MSTSAILFATLTVLVAAHARFIAPPLIHPIVPVPLIAPLHPPLMTPFIRPFIHPLHPPVFPIMSQNKVTRSRRIARPPSRPFVMEEPRGFLRREDEPVIINIVDSRDPIRDFVVIEKQAQPGMYDRNRYVEDTGDVSIDGNVYINDPYAVNDIKRGATVEQVVSRAVNSGQLTRGDAVGSPTEYDFPLTIADTYPVPVTNRNINIGNTLPIDNVMNARPITLI